MARPNDFMLKSDRDLLAARFEKRRLAWENKRRRGMFFFVFVETLKLGGVLVILNVVMDYLSSRIRFQRDFDLYGWRIGAFGLVFAVVLNVWEWHRNEKRYRRKAS